VNYSNVALHERLMKVLKHRDGHRIAHEVEQAKIRCSEQDGATRVDLSEVERGLGAAMDADAMRDHLGHLLARTVACARDCVQRAGLTDSTLDAIYLTGGDDLGEARPGPAGEPLRAAARWPARAPISSAPGRSACQIRLSAAQSRSIPSPSPEMATAEIWRELRA